MDCPVIMRCIARLIAPDEKSIRVSVDFVYNTADPLVIRMTFIQDEAIDWTLGIDLIETVLEGNAAGLSDLRLLPLGREVRLLLSPPEGKADIRIATSDLRALYSAVQNVKPPQASIDYAIGEELDQILRRGR